MVCDACAGTGECGPCDEYGNWDFDGVTECEVCAGDGVCVDCDGTGESTEPDEITEMGVGE